MAVAVTICGRTARAGAQQPVRTYTCADYCSLSIQSMYILKGSQSLFTGVSIRARDDDLKVRRKNMKFLVGNAALE